jgi:predicted AlkP superfamily phosphohydrolase/phosphomutase
MDNMKVVVLGFDGASPKLTDKWINNLPTFKTFKEKGIFGYTIPPVPAQTPVAWTTFMTGKNPGNHGIFSFAMRKKGTYERRIATPKILEAKTLFQILNESGKKVGVINVPMCGIQKVQGFIAPGFLSKNEGVFFPEDIREKIRLKFNVNKILGDLKTETLERVKEDPDLFFEEVNQITDEMAEIALYLLQKEDWDFFMTVFMGTDRIQHFFWKYVDPTHSNYEKNKYSQLVRDFYVKIDKITKSFLNSVDEDTITIVVSDHGFCPVEKEVVVNNYLEEIGLVKRKNGKIDLEKSKAISYGYGDVWLNVKRREPSGLIKPGKQYEEVRKKITDKLMLTKIDGQVPFKYIWKREDIYTGKYLSNAPDLLIIFNKGWQAARNPEIMEKNKSKRYLKENPMWSGGHDGTNDPVDVPGIICSLDLELEENIEIRVPLKDLAPTILSLMDVPIPRDMDVKPIKLHFRRVRST